MKEFSPFYRRISKTASKILNGQVKMDVRGLENLPKDQGCVIAANHYSEFDALVVMKALIDADIPVRVLAKAPLFKVPLLGWVMKKTEQVPVYRGTGQARDALGHAKSALDNGETVMIFPEGTLTRQPDYWPMKPKTGVGRLALAGYPVVPCAQWGALEIMGRYDRHLHLGRKKEMSVSFGAPIDFSNLQDHEDANAAARQASDRVIDHVTALLEELRGEEAPEVRYDTKVYGDPGKKALGQFERKRRKAAKKAN
ncbi:hypothetical protein BSR29_02695 [Boudabousia liubingyangii]|uniref:Phospholipid/glycerol acyltransferase domain-containing protein n=1 Tax=Boudabousia liubingyangii TaxID=1921764 RepID=A0A1Q5PMT3_9ACTO|nr:lysophospholipid acyltransferase family protein [Boudabousia liubingyangii]OKL48785.1 hypothetical protein BSR29_02695 [Boudabousia liubingyangii]